MEKSRKIVLITMLISVLCVTLLCSIFVSCVKQEEEKPWWDQHDKLEFVLEDERSEEKTLTYKFGEYDPKIHYIRDDKDKREYIPKVTVYYDGEVKEVFTVVFQRKYFIDNLDRYDSVVLITGLGKFRTNLRFYINEEDAVNRTNCLFDISIDIFLSKGDE